MVFATLKKFHLRSTRRHTEDDCPALTVTEISEVPLTETSSTGTSMEIVPVPCAMNDWSTPKKAVNDEPPMVIVADMLRLAPPASETS